MPAHRAFRVSCSGERHVVELHDGCAVRFRGHANEAEVIDRIDDLDRARALDVLAGVPVGDYRPDGCCIIALAIREQHFLTSHPDTGVRELIATLRGRELGRRAAERRRLARA